LQESEGGMWWLEELLELQEFRSSVLAVGPSSHDDREAPRSDSSHHMPPSDSTDHMPPSRDGSTGSRSWGVRAWFSMSLL
jgi:hypothetical protein